MKMQFTLFVILVLNLDSNVIIMRDGILILVIRAQVVTHVQMTRGKDGDFTRIT